MKLSGLILIVIMTLNAHQSVSQEKAARVDLKEFDKSVLLSDFFTSVNYLPLETNNSSFLTYPTQIQFFDSLLFFQDHKDDQIYVFSITGKFLNTIGRIGRGPGEQLTFGDFYIDREKKLIEILDLGTDNLFTYSFNDQVIGQRKLIWCSSFAKTNSGDYLMYSGYAPHFHDQKGKLLKSPIALVNDKGKVVNLFTSDFEPFGLGIRSIMSKNALSKIGDTILFCPNRSNVIYQYYNSNLTPRIYLDFGKREMPRKYANMNGLTYENISTFQSQFIVDINDFMESNDFIAFNFSYQSTLYQALINKKSHKKAIAKSTNYINDIDRIEYRYFHLMSYMDGYFIFYIHAVDFKNQISDIFSKMSVEDRNKYQTENSDIMNIYNNISINDNPIIVLFKCK